MTYLIVVPCFNEADRWNETYWADMTAISHVDWLFVSDGSTDSTNELLETFSAKHSGSVNNIKALILPTNVGKGEAIRAGWLSEREENYEAIGFIDADGAFNKEDVNQLLKSYHTHVTDGDFDAVWSSRVALAGRNIERHSSRHYIGRLVATFLSIGGHSLPYDTQSGLKLFKTTSGFWDSVGVPFHTRWLFEIELLVNFQRLSKSAMKIWEVPLDYWVDVAGSKVDSKESRRILIELFRVKQLQRQHRKTNS